MASKAKRRASKRAQVPAPPPGTGAARPRRVVAPKVRAPHPRRAGPGLFASPRRLYTYALTAAVLLGALLIGLSQVSVHRSATTAAPRADGTGVPGRAATAALLAGIPQRGNLLGSPSAPVVLVEYADPQCPYCAQYALNVLPTLIRDYVRPGKVQLAYRGLWFLGEDSGTALRTATAAGSENRFWHVIELLYRNQGPENAWVNDELLRSIVTAAGANADRVFAARDGAAVTTTIDRWAKLAEGDNVSGVPTFFFGRRGDPLEQLALTQLAMPEFRVALDGALER